MGRAQFFRKHHHGTSWFPPARRYVSALFALLLATASFAAEPPADFAKAARAAQKYDIVGIKLGIPLKEAMQALKAHNPQLKLKPETMTLPAFKEPLVYNVSATSPEEQFHLTLTLPPNPIVISRIGRQINFTKETAPMQQVVVEDLIKKYGQPTYDSGPDRLWAEFRLILWFTEEDGSPIMGQQGDMELMFDSFYTGGRTGSIGPIQLRGVQNRVTNIDFYDATPNSKRRLIQARLQNGQRLGLNSQDVVGIISVSMGDGILEQAGYRATNQVLVNNAKAVEDARMKGASQNRPKF